MSGVLYIEQFVSCFHVWRVRLQELMKKKKGSNENVPMTKKEREAMEAQLEKESEIRKKVSQVNGFFSYSLLDKRVGGTLLAADFS